MSDPQQAVLRSAWLDAKDGSLRPRASKGVGYERNQEGRWQAQAWHADYIAGKLKKKGGGSPSRSAVHQFSAKVDAYDDWVPVKAN